MLTRATSRVFPGSSRKFEAESEAGALVLTLGFFDVVGVADPNQIFESNRVIFVYFKDFTEKKTGFFVVSDFKIGFTQAVKAINVGGIFFEDFAIGQNRFGPVAF